MTSLLGRRFRFRPPQKHVLKRSLWLQCLEAFLDWTLVPNTLFFRSTQSNETVCRRRPDSQATEYPDSPMSQDSAKNSQSQSSRCKDKVGRK